jgi:hypothetical protein
VGGVELGVGLEGEKGCEEGGEDEGEECEGSVRG